MEEGIAEDSSDTFLDALEQMGLIRRLIPVLSANPETPLPRMRIRTSSSSTHRRRVNDNGDSCDENQDENSAGDEGEDGIVIDIDIEMPPGLLSGMQ